MVNSFIELLNEHSEYNIKIVDNIEELKHEDYKGKRVFVNIIDNNNEILNTKIDIGVHTYSELELEECIFDISLDEEGISLLANSKEQIVVEKLKSLLKFGENSTRYKDIYDIDYLLDSLDKEKLQKFIKTLIFDKTKYKDMKSINERLSDIFSNEQFIKRLEKSGKNWIRKETKEIKEHISKFFK